jgi:hypothetical protein
VMLRNASPELLELVAFMGLDDVIAARPRAAAAARRAGTGARCRGRT